MELCQLPGLIAVTDPVGRYEVLDCRDGAVADATDCIAEEVPVALIYNGISHAVMLASPQDLEDFALGFSLTEGILQHPAELYDIEVVPRENGIELQMEISAERFAGLKDRRRSMTGRTGCGLCGAESLQQALRIPTDVFRQTSAISEAAIHAGYQALAGMQAMQAMTGATHACAWVQEDGKVAVVREDVGRHNALDKLIGAMAKQHLLASPGFVFTTSRASYEMVQKTASVGISMLAAISAPTGLAVRIARRCGLTLIGFARGNRYVIYSNQERILRKEPA